MKFAQLAKSRTLTFNTIMSAAIAALPYLGLAVTPELVTAVMGIGNILLRFITTKSVHEK